MAGCHSMLLVGNSIYEGLEVEGTKERLILTTEALWCSFEGEDMNRILALMLLGGFVISPKTCNVSFGTGSNNPSSPSGFTLGVPFFYEDPSFRSCGPASVEMWAAYDGTAVTQHDIANYIGCTVNGATQGQILKGVQHFTASGRDADVLYNGGVGAPATIAGEFYSAEITSINALVPLIPLVNGATHAGVLIGGQWHIDPDTNLYVWDSVLFDDPAVGPGRPFAAADWTGYDDVEHIISRFASADAAPNYNQYSGRVAIRGSGLGGHPLPY